MTDPHTVRSKVGAPERKPVLPFEIFNRFVPESFWPDPRDNVSGVPVV